MQSGNYSRGWSNLRWFVLARSGSRLSTCFPLSYEFTTLQLRTHDTDCACTMLLRLSPGGGALLGERPARRRLHGGRDRGGGAGSARRQDPDPARRGHGAGATCPRLSAVAAWPFSQRGAVAAAPFSQRRAARGSRARASGSPSSSSPSCRGTWPGGGCCFWTPCSPRAVPPPPPYRCRPHGEGARVPGSPFPGQTVPCAHCAPEHRSAPAHRSASERRFYATRDPPRRRTLLGVVGARAGWRGAAALGRAAGRAAEETARPETSRPRRAATGRPAMETAWP